MLLAQKYDPIKTNPTGWYMSEKLDGVRCYWDGTAMYTRTGKPFYPPDFFKDVLPKDVCLDGELWTGRDEFQRVVSIVRRQDKNDDWNQVIYMVFDAPKIHEPFKKRIQMIKEIIDKVNSPYVKLVEHSVCESPEHLMKEMDVVTANKGEGLMIRDPESFYEGKRSDTLLKVKKFDDAEAVVIEHKKGTGRCSHMMGAILVREKDGTEFKIGSGFDDA